MCVLLFLLRLELGTMHETMSQFLVDDQYNQIYQSIIECY